MAIPDYQTIMLPLLKLVKAEGPISNQSAIEKISDEFKLTKEERLELLPSGQQEKITNRVIWARTYLKKAGLIDSPSRGINVITEEGIKLLTENPPLINVKLLKRYPAFLEFQNLTKKDNDEVKSASSVEISDETPEEVLESSFLNLKQNLMSELLTKIKSCSPEFFERLVVEVLLKMGYGGSRKDAGQAIGRSGDEGIDGIINEDKLGLDVIYIQAKRWENNVDRPEIQKFAGALQGKRARKGIFITTSKFSPGAIEFARSVDSKIILISGDQLCEMMWENGVGVTTHSTYEVKKIDSDFFVE
jgi:restriction system protein